MQIIPDDTSKEVLLCEHLELHAMNVSEWL